MWRINAAASLVSIGVRGVLVREAFPAGKGDAVTAPLCVAEIAFIAALGIEQPFKWWVALIFLLVYFLVPAVFKVLLSDHHVHRLVEKFGDEKVEKIEAAINVSLLEFGIMGTAVTVLAVEIHHRDEDRPWISLGIAIAITILTLFLAFKPNANELTQKFYAKMKTLSKSSPQDNEENAVVETEFSTGMGHAINQRAARLRF